MADRVHIVREGEWLTSIAHQYGFPSGDDLYQHEKNKALREKRPDPSVIYPGDEVWIPPCPYEVELEMKSTGGGPHTITAELPGKETLDIVLRDSEGEPLKDTPYEFRIGGYSTNGTTDGDGRLTEEFDSRYLRFGSYMLIVEGREIELKVGHLDPIDTTKGVQARLNNLGYNAGTVDGELGNRTRSAIRQFQVDHGLKADGIAGPKTRKKLDEAYG